MATNPGFEKITVTNWGTTALLENVDYMAELTEVLADMLYDNLTDGGGITISIEPFVRERFWRDQAAAQQFRDYVMNILGPKYNIYPVSMQIKNNPYYLPAP